ncbi:MAG: energy transducer TonB [Ignavibacteriaceae bacterium]
MKRIFSYLMLIFFLAGVSTFAQEKELDQMPSPIGGIAAIAHNVVYPQSAKENKIEGKVMIKTIIDAEGNVVSTTVEKGLNAECDKAAEAAIKKTKFNPGMKNGKAVESEVTIPIMFKLS